MNDWTSCEISAVIGWAWALIGWLAFLVSTFSRR
jgi:hypothetical protein